MRKFFAWLFPPKPPKSCKDFVLGCTCDTCNPELIRKVELLCGKSVFLEPPKEPCKPADYKPGCLCQSCRDIWLWLNLQ